MNYIVLICPGACDGRLVLTVSIKEKKLVAICNKCNTLYEITNIDLSDEDMAAIKECAKKITPEAPLFYTRATRSMVV